MSAILLTACQTTSTGTDVTLQSIKFVCLSRKDTDGTKRQVAENNAALLALGAKQRKCKRGRDGRDKVVFRQARSARAHRSLRAGYWWASNLTERVNSLERTREATAPQADRLTRVEVRLESVQSGIDEIKPLIRREREQ